MEKKYILLILALVFCKINTVFAQNKAFDKSTYYNYENNFYTEIYTFPTSKLDSLTFYFFYKIAYDDLVFQLNKNEEYFTVANIEANFKDSEGIIRKRIITNDTIYAENFDESVSKSKYFINLVQFTVINSNYDISIKLLNSKSFKANSIEKKVVNCNSATKKNMFCDIYFTGEQIAQDEYEAFINNSVVPFLASEFSILIPMVSTDTINSSIGKNMFDYKIISKKDTKSNDYKSSKIWGAFNELEGSARVLENKKISAELSNNRAKIKLQKIVFDVDTTTTTNNNNNNNNNHNNIGLLKIDIKSGNFPPGYYELIVKNKFTDEEKKFSFEIRWSNIPLSLLDAEYATDLMHYVLTDTEFKEIKKGNKEEQYRKIIKYWEKFDPSPGTLYNEALATYFNRVDYAFFNFQTITNKDGAKTDRGKIYILYGLPDKIISDVHNGINCEVWHYYKLKQIFTFDIISVGNYKLVEIKEINSK